MNNTLRYTSLFLVIILNISLSSCYFIVSGSNYSNDYAYKSITINKENFSDILMKKLNEEKDPEKVKLLKYFESKILETNSNKLIIDKSKFDKLKKLYPDFSSAKF